MVHLLWKMEKKIYSKCLDRERVVEIVESIRKIPSANPVFVERKKDILKTPFLNL